MLRKLIIVFFPSYTFKLFILFFSNRALNKDILIGFTMPFCRAVHM